MLEAIQLLVSRRELVSELTKKGIRLKYRHSYLGIVWSLFEPILSIAVLVIIFGTLLGHKEPSFILYVACGRLLYSFFMEGTQSACNSIRNNAEIIKKVYVPRVLYPMTEILWRYIVFLISLVVLIPLMVYVRVDLTVNLFMVLPALLILLLLTLGMGTILATCNVFFRDTEFLWKLLLPIIMYMSAIFYYPDRILESHWAFLLRYNPLFCIIQIFRSAFTNEMLSRWDILYPAGFSIILIIIASALFRKYEKRFVLYI